MTKKKVLVSGCNGQMGQVLIRLIGESEFFEVLYGFDKFAREISDFVVVENLNDIEDMEIMPDIIIDFSSPKATMQIIEFARKFKIPTVIATTNLSCDELEKIKEYSKFIPIFQSANMSIATNIVKNILRIITPILAADSDIEISETHHRNKKDSPSGTAIMLANSINEALGKQNDIICGRTDKRNTKEIGISSIRGGNVAGSHSVFFFGDDETLEIKITTNSRDIYAIGAIKAAKFLLNQAPGLYGMDDLN